ncbi:glycosyltransferase [Patescibacteria group bacterium]|nr:glycosyltransferase [Patescibacteria group bacterium]
MNKLIEYQPSQVKKTILEYKKFNTVTYQQIIKSAKKLDGKVVLHINSACKGGGVAELLRSQVAIEQSLDIRSYWFVMQVPERFFAITKKIHNLLQGDSNVLNKKEKDYYLAISHKIGKSLTLILDNLKPDIIMIHDPQPLPLILFIPKNLTAILRLHPDLSHPCLKAINLLKPFITRFNGMILSNSSYSRSFPWLKSKNIRIIMPAIDPLSEKNRLMDMQVAQSILKNYNIDCSKPIISQVSRFDYWKDPLGVVKAYFLAKKKIPELQLILAGFFLAQDDPEALSVFKEVKKFSHGHSGIFLFSDPRKLKSVTIDLFVNAVYTASTIMIQKSIREGFGLTITEAMWKGKAVIAGKSQGALVQIKNKKNGIIISSPKEAGTAIVRLLQNNNERLRLGKAAVKSVKRKFLLPRFILENLKAYIAFSKK